MDEWIKLALGIIIVLLLWIFTYIGEMRKEIGRLKLKLQKLTEYVGYQNPEFQVIEDEVRSLLVEGKKIEAIKRYRNATGCGLKEAKETVDSINKELRNNK